MNDNPERSLALTYAPAPAREALAALLALDDALARLLRTTSEPALGQIRLAWWRDALTALDEAAPPAEPVLQALATVRARGVRGAELAGIVDGWEALIEAEVLDEAALARFGDARGATLFELGGRVLGALPGDPLAQAGTGWALADLARNINDGAAADRARALAEAAFARAGGRWSANARALGALAHLARMDIKLPPDQPVPMGAPGRVARLFWHRITGR